MNPDSLISMRTLLILAALILVGGVSPLCAQDETKMPLTISERMWRNPGPEQDGDGPKLLIVFPAKDTRLEYSEEKTRFAGRVDPPDTEVRLDGEPVKLYPGGVFTGLLTIPIGERKVVFSAKNARGRTIVTRMVTRSDQERGPAHWPLAFHPKFPVQPSGAEDYWLRSGSNLKVRLLASPGHDASVRIGESGEWLSMQPAYAAVEEGGAYETVIEVKDDLSEQPTPLHFRVQAQAEAGHGEKTVSLESKLKIRRIPEEKKITGVVAKSLGTYLQKEEGWDRWGNFVRDTPFPVIEKRGPRIRVDFGQGETGWVETESVKIDAEPRAVLLPKLGKPEVRFKRHRTDHEDEVMLVWKTEAPIACVFRPNELSAEGLLRVSLIGAGGAEAEDIPMPPAGYFSSIRVLPGSKGKPPQVEIRMKDRPLWGYGIRKLDGGKIGLLVRAFPDIPQGSPSKPLGGLRVMIDAGHGGKDQSAIGPSGISEAEINLVVAAHLGIRLREMGAEVRQLRTEDVYVDLDDRVDRALTWDPDLFISVHHNDVGKATSPMSDHGPKVYYHYPHSIPLAGSVAGELTRLLEPDGQPRVLREVFRVNRNLSPYPSILVEGAFVCNPEDEFKLRKTETLKAMARSIAEGVRKRMLGNPLAEN